MGYSYNTCTCVPLLMLFANMVDGSDLLSGMLAVLAQPTLDTTLFPYQLGVGPTIHSEKG